MELKYTEEELNSLDKEMLIRLFLLQQKELENIDRTLQLVLEQVADLKRHRFGRSSEAHEPDEQISFMETDGKIVFFNESEAVAAEDAGEYRGSGGTAGGCGGTLHDPGGIGRAVWCGRMETASG